MLAHLVHIASVLSMTLKGSPNTDGILRPIQDLSIQNKFFRKGGEAMRKLAVVLLMMSLLATLAACATTSSKDKVRIKCPACGYEFDAPVDPA